MPRKVLAFVPQHTTTKSRIMALVDKGDGHELDAIATVDWPHEAVTICNMLNSPKRGLEAFSGLWFSLPASVRANLERARDERIDDNDERDFLAPWFITELSTPELPGDGGTIEWAKLFPATQCPAEGCENCDGCPGHAASRGDEPGTNRCGPGGTCRCITDDIDDCGCAFWDVGPRWAAALYSSLHDLADVLVGHAEDLMWGTEGPAVGFPKSLIAQPPKFFVRLAQTCIDLCDVLAQGKVPVPHTIAELLMLDEAARSYLDGHVGGSELEVESMKEEFGHLPEAHGDFELDALWMFQFTDSDWTGIAEADEIYPPNSMNSIFDLLPEATQFPRNQKP
ncbi:hypothetical protein [Actinoplanes subglobosus]|uniref:Uncharacterized protein n=1 Tax=Actinoplanes subglobosus TaxID=1547892 RepID=A0ABV8IKN1_9ACTN